MGGLRRGRIIGLAVAMLVSIAVYLRLWTIDYSISSDEAELLRKQFDHANKEAMDESAEWRLRYDEEAERFSKCEQELKLNKTGVLKGRSGASKFDERLTILQKEKKYLVEQVEMLRKELEVVKLKCNSINRRGS